MSDRLTLALDADAARGGALLLALAVDARLEVAVHLPLGHVRPELERRNSHMTFFKKQTWLVRFNPK